MKAIILAGGSGSRLYPMTAIVSKQLQPVFDKPMIFYPLSILMLCGVSEYLVISTERDTPLLEKLLGDGSSYGIKITYAVQAQPKGLPEAFVIGEEFIAQDDVVMILGDNLFYGDLSFLERAIENQKTKSDIYKARVFGYYVDDPRSYGVVEFDKKLGKVLSVEEKPEHPKSNYAIPGIYIFDGTVSQRARGLKASERGETEIVDLIKSYLATQELGIEFIGRGVTWLDTGTPDALLEAGLLISSNEKRSGIKIACLEEIAYRKGLLSEQRFLARLDEIPNSPYKKYLQKVYYEKKADEV